MKNWNLIFISLIGLTQAQVPTYRLTGGFDSSNGILEVFYNGTWGTICDDGFNANAVRVACNHFGIANGTMLTNKTGITPSNQSQIWLDDISCNGTEARIDLCRHPPFGIHNCGHGEDVALQCGEVLTTTTTSTTTTVPTTTELPTTTDQTTTQESTMVAESTTTTELTTTTTEPPLPSSPKTVADLIPVAANMTNKPLQASTIQSQCTDFSADQAVPPNRDEPNLLEMAFQIDTLHDVDIVNRVISVGGLILLHWTVDTCLANETTMFQGRGRQNLYVPDPAAIWKPKLKFMSSAESDIFMGGSTFGTDIVTQIKVVGDYQIIDFYYLIYGKFDSSCPMALQNFPLDEQTCTLEFDLSRPASILQIDPEKVNFLWQGAENGEWRKKNGDWRLLTKKFGGQLIHAVEFDITVSRNSQYYVVYLALPILILGFVALASFLVPPEQPDRPMLTVTVLLALYFSQTEVLNRLPVIESQVLLGSYVVRMTIFTAAVTVLQLAILFLANVVTQLHGKVFKGRITIIRLFDLAATTLSVFSFIAIQVLAFALFREILTKLTI